jgi:hypothetical protein
MSNEKPNPKLLRYISVLEGCTIVQVEGMTFAPHYSRGDLLFMRKGERLRIRDHVSVRTKAGRHVLGAYVELRKGKTVIQRFDAAFKFDAFDASEIESVAKIVAAVHR